MRNDCEIVKDLLPNYVENLLSSETRKYVDEHLDSCGKCRYIFKLMKDEKINGKTKEDQENQIEFDYLKKYKKRTIILKMIALIFVFIILFGGMLLIIKYNKINNVINSVNIKGEELKELNNYTMYVTSHEINFKTNKEAFYYNEYYYKDGKYKEVFTCQGITFNFAVNGKTVKYGSIGDNKQISIDESYNSIINYTYNYTPVSKGKYIKKEYESLYFYPKNAGFYTLLGKASLAFQYKIRNDRFNGIECYVLRIEDKEGYNETWINKENGLPTRKVRENYGQFYDERIVTLYIGNVKDEDVEFNKEHYEGYTIENKEYIIEDEKEKKLFDNI